MSASSSSADEAGSCPAPAGASTAGAWAPVRLRGLDPAASYAVRPVEGVEPGDAVLHPARLLLEQGLQPSASVSSALWLVAREPDR